MATTTEVKPRTTDAGPTTPEQPLHVLIVEDSPADAELTVAVLKRAGYPLVYDVVDSAVRFEQSLDKATYDLILCDHNLITWTGMDALGIAKRMRKDIPFVTVSAVLGDEAAVEYIKQGATDYVLKHRLDRLPVVVGRAMRERAHREEEARLQNAVLGAKRDWELTFDAVPDMVLLIDGDCRIQRANRAVTQFAKAGFSQIIGKHCYEVLLGLNEPPPGCPRARVLQNVNEGRGEIEDLPSGRTFEATVSPLRERSGSLAGCVCVMRDITDRRRAELVLNASEMRYRCLFECAKDGILILNAESGEIIDVNPYLTDLLQYPREDLLGKKLWDLCEFKDVASSQTAFQELQTAQSIRYENIPLQIRDGRLIEVEFASNSYLVGKFKVIQCNIRDITERVQLKDAIRKGDQRYRELLDHANDAIYTTDLAGNFTSCNKMAQRISGYSLEELLKMNINQLLAPEYLVNVQAEIHGAMEGKEPVTAEVEILSKGGQRVALEVNARIITENGKPAGQLGVARDVTARKLLESQLRQAQKMEAIGRFSGGVAHDFNNLLNVILGYSELALESIEPDAPIHKQLKEIKAAAERGASLTRQLLAFGRKQVLLPTVLDLNAVVAECEKLVKRLVGDDIKVVTALGSNLGRIKADSGQIDQIIMNLAVNARDAMPDGGKLIIETSSLELDESFSKIHAEVQPGPYAMLAVSDNGIGMDEGIQEHIFEPFFTTKGVGKGTGLGLSTVYGIVQQSNGHIFVYSEPGKGTTFKIYFPQVQEPLQPAVAPPPVGELQGSECILLVEDEPALRNLAREYLEQSGYTVLEAETPKEAMQVSEQFLGPIEMLLTDVVMPEFNGRQLAEYLTSLRPFMKVLYMSGYTDTAIVNLDDPDAGTHFLTKPFSKQGLLSKVRTVLDSKEGSQLETAK